MNETHTVKYRRPLTLTVVFLAGFVFFLFACRLTDGEMHQFTTTDLSQVYLFLYANLPCAIVKLLGLVDYSAFGIIYSLVSCTFFLVMGILLYCCPTDEEFSDKADPEKADSLLRHILHYACSFPFLQMVCLATAHIVYGIKYVQHPRLYCFVAPLLFLSFTVIEFFTAKTRAQKWKSLCRLLASVSVTLGVAGLAGRIGDHELNGLVLPMAIRRLLIQFTDLCGTNIFGAVAMLLLLVASVVALVFCVRTVIRTGCDHLASLGCISVHILILFAISFFSTYFSSTWQDAAINAKNTSYWLLMLVAMATFGVIYGRANRRNGVVVCTSGILFFTVLSACLDALRAFSGNISSNLSRLTALGLPIEQKAFELITKYCPKGHWSYAVFLVALLVVVVVLFILLYKPFFKISDEDYEKSLDYEYVELASPLQPMVCSLAFLLGYGLSCLSHSILKIWWIGLVSYYLCALAIIVAALCLTVCILLKYTISYRYYALSLGVTMVLGVLLTFFAQFIAAVVCGVAIAFAIYGCIAAGIANSDRPRDRSRIQRDRMINIAEGSSLLEDIEALERAGEISSSEAQADAWRVARTMRQRDEDLKEELDSLDW